MEENNVKYHSNVKPGLTFGIILVLVGALFLAFNFGLLKGDWKYVVFSWQMLLIVIGFISMFYRQIFNGLALIAAGGFFILPRLAAANPEVFGWAGPGFTRTYWPVLLIIAGVLILLHILFRPKLHSVRYYTNAPHHRCNGAHRRGINIGGLGFDRNSIFGNVEEIILEPEFKGGEMNAVFGSIMLDLRRTNIPEGETEIELNAVFGGITIYLPEHWHVELHLSSVFGGFADNRVLSSDIDHSRKLVIYGSCVFGGGEIRS